MPAPAARLARIGASQIREISELAWNTPGTVVLSLGEPDLATSPHILRASQDALERDDTRYTPNAGIAPLREAIADWHRVRGNTHVTADRVWVTAGGAEAILLACVLTLDVGDEVLVPDPGYPPFAMAAQVADAQVVPYPLRVEDGFIPDPDVVDALITDRTRLLVLNTPSNPLGTVLEAEHLAALLDVARRHDLWVLSDECYAGFTYDTPHVSATALDADDRVLTLDTFSKTYAMTGFRVGSLLVPRAFDAFLPRVQEALVSCVNTPAQYGALAALTGPQDDVGRAADIYRLHRDTATRLLEARGFTVLPARGGIYLWVDLSHASAGDVHDLARRLVTERGVAVAPGSAFGAQGEGWVRVSLTASEADLVEGLSRLPAPRG